MSGNSLNQMVDNRTAAAILNYMVKRQADLDALFGALADPTRRRLVAVLAAGPRTVGELAGPFDMSLVAVSKHLQVLERAGLVARTRRGRSTECTLRPKPLQSVADWVAHYEEFWSARLAALDQLVRERKRRPT